MSILGHLAPGIFVMLCYHWNLFVCKLFHMFISSWINEGVISVKLREMAPVLFTISRGYFIIIEDSAQIDISKVENDVGVNCTFPLDKHYEWFWIWIFLARYNQPQSLFIRSSINLNTIKGNISPNYKAYKNKWKPEWIDYWSTF